MNKKFSYGVVIIFCITAIFIGKALRYTVLYESLVEQGSGHQLIKMINKGDTKFKLTTKTGENEQDAGANAVFIYDKINIFNIKTYLGFEVYLTIIFNIIIFFILFKIKKKYTLYELVYLLFFIGVLNIWDFCLAKEPVQMLYFIAIFLILINNKIPISSKYLLCFLVYLISSITYRNYYITMAIFFVILYLLYELLLKKIEKFKFMDFIKILLIMFSSYFIVIFIMKTFSISNYNKLLWVRLNHSVATTGINAFFNSTNTFVFTFEIILIIFRMLFPIEILKHGISYFLYFLFQCLLSKSIINNLIIINKICETKKIALFVTCSFLLGSALFEPDFGSWVRHEAVLFPLFLILNNFLDREVQSNDKI